MTLNINNSIKFDYIIYTDGACIGNPGPGGWAAIIFYGKDKNIISGFEKQTTNNRMELIASISPPVENAHSPGLGSVERLEEDRILINWGIFGVIEEVDFESNRYWSVEAPIQHVYGMSRGITTSKLP